METVNYFWNYVSTKIESHEELIPEDKWSNKYQNVSHIRIYESKVLVNILKEKRNKSDHHHIWKWILIGFSSNTTKHYWIWVPETKHVLIVSNPYINKSTQRAKLLIKCLLDLSWMNKKSCKQAKILWKTKKRAWPACIFATLR